jgi:hypothetical protein
MALVKYAKIKTQGLFLSYHSAGKFVSSLSPTNQLQRYNNLKKQLKNTLNCCDTQAVFV